MEKIHLSRKERIKLFLYEYYFGQNYWIRFMRLVMGPVLTLIGIGLYSDAQERFGIAYGGLCIVYGLYYTFKPLIWIALRRNMYKAVDFEIELTPESVKLNEVNSSSETAYSAFKRIVNRKTYFVLEVENGGKIYLPKIYLLPEGVKILEAKSR